MVRFWLTIFPVARVQLREYEQLAAAIPDPELRMLALTTLRAESLSAMGAALVATTVDRPDPALVRLLVAVQVAWDYIDTLAEQPAPDPIANGVQLHGALLAAIDLDAPPTDYYRYHPGPDDGGYLAALVAGCRDACASLPAHHVVYDAVMRQLETAQIQYMNQAPAAQRVAALRTWAAARSPDAADSDWVELAAAASSSLGVLAMLAAAASPLTTPAAVERVMNAYVPSVDALTALLDSLVDRPADEAAGLMNWVSHYPGDAFARARLCEIVVRALAEARALPHGGRHVVIVVGMIAMHLSQPTAWRSEAESTTRAVLNATDTIVTPLLLLLLRTWRWARSERAEKEIPLAQGSASYSV